MTRKELKSRVNQAVAQVNSADPAKNYDRRFRRFYSVFTEWRNDPVASMKLCQLIAAKSRPTTATLQESNDF